MTCWLQDAVPLPVVLLQLLLHQNGLLLAAGCTILHEPVQCFAGYFDIEYGHLLDGEKQMGVIINTCKEFNLLPLAKGYLPLGLLLLAD